MRTKTESFTARLGLSRAAPALRGQSCSDLQPFQRLPSHCGAKRFKGLGTVSRQSNVMSTAFRHSCLVPPSSTALSSARARSCSPIRPFLAETEHFTQALSVSQLGASSTLGGNSVGLDMCAPFRFDDSRGNMILTRSRHTILPKSTTLASREASRFRALRSGTVKIPVDSHRPHICDWSQRGTDSMYLTLKEKEVVLHQYAERAELCSE